MVAYEVALFLTILISTFVPLMILVVIVKRSPMERKSVFGCFLLGFVVYGIMQWGIKEHLLQYLYDYTNLPVWMQESYLLYLFLVAFTGAILVVVPFAIIIRFVFRRQMSFAKASMFGLGYGMAEATLLVGIRCVDTLIQVSRGDLKQIETSLIELYLSGYERVLYLILITAVTVGLVYLVEQNMLVRGILISVLTITFANFLPGFLIAFTTKKYVETFERPVALVISYLVLSVGAFAGIVVLNALKYSLKDDRIDSKQAILAYQRKMEQKMKQKKK